MEFLGETWEEGSAILENGILEQAALVLPTRCMLHAPTGSLET